MLKRAVANDLRFIGGSKVLERILDCPRGIAALVLVLDDIAVAPPPILSLFFRAIRAWREADVRADRLESVLELESEKYVSELCNGDRFFFSAFHEVGIS